MYNILFIRKKRDLHFQKPKTDIIIKRLIQYYQQQPVNFINSQPILHTNLERERESQLRKAVKKKKFLSYHEKEQKVTSPKISLL